MSITSWPPDTWQPTGWPVALLLRLPGRAGWLGLLLGIGAAAVVGIALWLLDVAGMSGVSFFGLLIFKALYCGLLGFGVARWTILRQLGAGDDSSSHNS